MNTPNKLLVGGVVTAAACLLVRIAWGTSMFGPALLYVVVELVINVVLLAAIVAVAVGGVWSLVAARRTSA